MAETLPNGTVIPKQTEPISQGGVIELRTLGVSVDTQLGMRTTTEYVDTKAAAASWVRGTISAAVNLDSLVDSGSYTYAGQTYLSLGYPVELADTITEIEVRRLGTAPMRALMTVKISTPDGVQRQFQREQRNGIWSIWRETARLEKALSANDHLNDLVASGSYIYTGTTYLSRGYPAELAGTLTEVDLRRIGTAPMRALMTARISLEDGTELVYRRSQRDGVWSPWRETSVVQNIGGEHLDTLDRTGSYLRTGVIYRSVGYPVDTSADYTEVTVRRIGTGRVIQEASVYSGTDKQDFHRIRSLDGWSAWSPSGGGGSSGYGGTAQTEMESTGRWTSQPAEEAYLRSLATHEYVSMFEIGRSVEDRPIWALQVGPGEVEYPNQKRSVLFTAGMHGNEPGPREGALQFIRDLVNPKTITYDKVHMIAVVVPTLNPDRIMDTRNNANDVNLNRDFLDYSQPESQALRNLMQSPDHDFVAYIDGHNGGYGHAVSTRWNDQDPLATPLVKQLSEDLDRQIADRYIQQGMPWRMYGEPGFEGIPGDGTLINGAFMRFGGQFGVPSELVEVPRTFRSFPAWQAQITKEAFHEVWEYVSVHREAFKAAKTAAGF